MNELSSLSACIQYIFMEDVKEYLSNKMAAAETCGKSATTWIYLVHSLIFRVDRKLTWLVGN